jgi:hypothetical protein
MGGSLRRMDTIRFSHLPLRSVGARDDVPVALGPEMLHRFPYGPFRHRH